MKNSTKWIVVATLVAAGAVGLACGGGNSESNPPNNAASASAPAASSAAPAESTTAATSATPAASTAAPEPPAPPLTVVAMKMMLPKAKAAVVVKEDGTVEVSGKAVMKFVGAELQKDGKAIVSVAADGTVKLEGASKAPKFNAKDELEVGDGAKMFVTDAGVVKLVNPDGKEDKDSGKVKFTGFKPPARRAATVLVLAALMPSGPPQVSVSGPSSATPAASAPKKK